MTNDHVVAAAGDASEEPVSSLITFKHGHTPRTAWSPPIQE
jgi:hypothetical protein